jgi:opacity protein-like surface antigen
MINWGTNRAQKTFPGGPVIHHFKSIGYAILLSCLCTAATSADYTKGTTMFQIYGGGAGLGGHYNQPGVSRDEQDLADGGGLIGGQFLYFFHDSPCLAAGFDISHASFDDFNSYQLLTNRFTSSSANTTTGVAIVRLSYPKGHFRPYVQGGLGLHHTSLSLTGSPINGTTWSDTGTTEQRQLLDSGHIGAALEGAIGLHIYFTERFFIGAELKVLDLMGQEFEPTAAGAHEGLQRPDRTVAESGIGLMIGLGF